MNFIYLYITAAEAQLTIKL